MERPLRLLAIACALQSTASLGSPLHPGAAAAIPTPTPHRCQIKMDGSEFLAEAQRRGIRSNSDCLTVDLATNHFFAKPDQGCSLSLSSKAWLDADWQFVRLEGAGRFASNESPDAVGVTIEAGGGFILKSMTVATGRPFPDAVCKAATLGTVLH
jgi:hypothetical protein